MKVRLKMLVRRQDAAGGRGARPIPYTQAYKVEATGRTTVLEALLAVADADDPTLAFRRSCRSAICGSCAMTINGRARLACSTRAVEEYERFGSLVVEPLANHEVMKDLVVDMAPFWKRMEKARPFLTPKEGCEAAAITEADEAAIDSSQRCVMCACCNAECSALEADPSFIGPAALAKAWRFTGDVREAGAARRIERLSGEHGLWDCVRCVRCTEYCPKEVDPLKAIELLRSRAISEGLTDNPGARHVESMAASVRRTGRLDEAAMTLKTLGLLRSLGMIPLGLRMERHGKMPTPHIFEQIEGMDEVRALFDEAAAEREKKGRPPGGD